MKKKKQIVIETIDTSLSKDIEEFVAFIEYQITETAEDILMRNVNSYAAKTKAELEKLQEKYLGNKVTPNHKGYWESNPKRSLVVDGVKYADLGTNCNKTLMFHFEGDAERKWEIAKHFTDASR